MSNIFLLLPLFSDVLKKHDASIVRKIFEDIFYENFNSFKDTVSSELKSYDEDLNRKYSKGRPKKSDVSC